MIVNTTYENTVDKLIQAVNPADSVHQRIHEANKESKKKQKLDAQRSSADY